MKGATGLVKNKKRAKVVAGRREVEKRSRRGNSQAWPYAVPSSHLNARVDMQQQRGGDGGDGVPGIVRRGVGIIPERSGPDTKTRRHEDTTRG